MTKYPSIVTPSTASSNEIGEPRGPRPLYPLLQVRTSPRPTDASPPGAVAAALQDIPPATTLSRHLEGTTQRDIVAPCTELYISEILSTASTPAPPPREQVMASCDAGPASTSTSSPLLPIPSVVGFSILASPTYILPHLPLCVFYSRICIS